MVDYLLRHDHDQLRPRSGRHDVESVQAQEELVFVGDGVGISEGERGEHDVSLLALKTLNSVDGLSNPLCSLSLKDALEARDDQRLLCPVRGDDPHPLPPKVLQ